MVDSSASFRCPFSDQEIVSSQPYGLLENAAVGVSDGIVEWVALTSELPELKSQPPEQIEGDGALLTPGLIDCHTHLIYGGNRAAEWEMRLNGRSYEQISREGGGINSSVRATRAASELDLIESASKRLRRLIAEGVTTVEIKSGYGLDVETEIKMLRVAKSLADQFPVTIEPTLLGAHAVPPEYTNKTDQYIDLVCQEMIPAAKGLCTAVDVFCESIAFDLGQTRRVFESAIDAGLNFKVHAEQLTHMGAAAMAAQMGAISADHLEYLTGDDCALIGQTGMVATLLPGAFYCLSETRKPPVDALRRNDVPIAVATDCNPGSSPVESILTAGNMACNLFGMTPEETLAGVTRNAAQALGRADSVGTIEPGKRADFAIWDVQNPAEIFYGLGHQPCQGVYKSGQPVVLDRGNVESGNN